MPKVTIDKHVNIGKEQVIKREINIFCNQAISEISNTAPMIHGHALCEVKGAMIDAHASHVVADKVLHLTGAATILFNIIAGARRDESIAGAAAINTSYERGLLVDINRLLTKLITQF